MRLRLRREVETHRFRALKIITLRRESEHEKAGCDMKTKFELLIVLLICVPWSAAQDPGWPRQMTKPEGKLIYYQPQIDSWKDYRELEARMAVSLTPAGGKATPGVVEMKAQTQVDVDKHNVTISKVAVTRTNFPGMDPTASAKMEQLVKTFLNPNAVVTISLDRLVASVNKAEQATKVSGVGVKVDNTPPVIFVSHSPAILVQVDGEPVKGSIPKTNLEFIVNTNFPVFFDKSSKKYFLFTGKQWLTATAPDAQWSTTAELPKDMKKLPEDPQWAPLKQAIPPPASSGPAPKVFYSLRPAEVILFQGQPVYSTIPGTQLVYAKNTDSNVFVYNPTKQYYFLAAGRWFSASRLEGPWTFATPELPPDFARIPANSPASRVLASVPGTEEAKDAVLLAQIPTTVVVDPKSAAAQVKVSYNGDPEFKPIEGTSMSFAANTPDKVIKVGDLYYLCMQGVWFVSTTPQGPWETATEVPKEIYTIPASSPVYNVTYVTQTTTPEGDVESSYTAGYLGTFVVGLTVGAIIADGTGYYYPPYIGYGYGYPYYHPYAATYGVYGVSSYYSGPYGASRGVYGPYGGATASAGYNPYTGTYARGATAYGPYGSRSVGQAYNPYTGTYARGASASTAYGTRSAAGAYNPYTGTAAATRQGSSVYGSWGSSVVSTRGGTTTTQHASTARGTYGAAQTSAGGKAVAGTGAYGSGYAGKTAGGDMYAGKDGNVYKNTGGGWQKYDNGSWNSVDTSAAQQRAESARSNASERSGGQSFNRSELNQEAQNRQRGAAQSDRYARSGGGGGGGRAARGGGRGRR